MKKLEEINKKRSRLKKRPFPENQRKESKGKKQ